MRIKVNGEHYEMPPEWQSTSLLSVLRDHLGLTKDPMFTDNVLFLLLEDPRE